MTTYYVGSYYEKKVRGSEQNERKTYFAGTIRIAVRENGTLTWLIADHLGSTSLTVDASGALLSSLKYTAFGELRSGTASTDSLYTGQRQEAEIGLYFYVSRFFDPSLGRFISPDSIVPGAGNPQAYDRYAYANNNPIVYIDPTGHIACIDGEQCFKPRLLVTNTSGSGNGNGSGKINLSIFNEYEQQVLDNLMNSGSEGIHAASYIIENQIRIKFKEQRWGGGGWGLGGNITVDPSFKNSGPNNPFVIGLIAHEAYHLEQGFNYALSKVGEIEAWKLGFTVQRKFSNQELVGISKKIADLDLGSVYINPQPAIDLIHAYNVANGDKVYNFMFNLLPVIPFSVQYYFNRFGW